MSLNLFVGVFFFLDQLTYFLFVNTTVLKIQIDVFSYMLKKTPIAMIFNEDNRLKAKVIGITIYIDIAWQNSKFIITSNIFTVY